MKLMIQAYFVNYCKKKAFLLCRLVVFCTIMHAIYQIVWNYQSNLGMSNKTNSIKYVQLLTGRFLYKDWSLNGLGYEAFKNCKEKRCFAIKPYFRQIPIETSDAVVVHAPNLYNMPDRKKYKRNRKQIWMYYSMESTRNSYCSMFYQSKDLDEWFNLTATYKQDSDFVSGIIFYIHLMYNYKNKIYSKFKYRL